MAPEVNRADRVLVWLVLAGLVFGGLATMAVAFSAERVLAGLSAAEAPGHDDGAAAHEEGADGGGDHDGEMSMPTAVPSTDHGAAMPMSMPTAAPSTDHGAAMPMPSPTATATGHGDGPSH